MLPAPGGVVALANGRRLAYDDVGDPSGFPVVYLHGCPDSCLARHPDDSIAARTGVRLIAIDRPGYGGSEPTAETARSATAHDVVAVLDHIGVEQAGVLGWSAGGQYALACAAVAPQRVSSVSVVAGTTPYSVELDVDEAAAMLLPPYVTYELALENVVEWKSPAYKRDLESVPGLHEQLARALCLATIAGVRADLQNFVSPFEFDLSTITTPVTLWYGSADDVVEPAIGSQLAQQLPNASLHVIDGASHLLLLTHWTQILESLRKEPSCR